MLSKTFVGDSLPQPMIQKLQSLEFQVAFGPILAIFSSNVHVFLNVQQPNEVVFIAKTSNIVFTCGATLFSIYIAIREALSGQLSLPLIQHR